MKRIILYHLLNTVRRGWGVATYQCKVRETAVLQRYLPSLVKNVPAQTFPPCSLPVHLLLSRDSLLMGLWAVRSFQHFTERCWKVIFHDDGSLRDQDEALLQKHFPLAVVWRRADADRKMEAALAKYPNCLQIRRSQVFSLKLFDPFFASEEDRLMVLDSDVLFFKKPAEILEWAGMDQPGFVFNSDFQSAYGISNKNIEARFGMSLREKINSGLALIPRAGISLDLVEDFLKEFPKVADHYWMEQTVYALLASKFGQCGLLPPTYEISYNRKRGASCVARHYVTGEGSRQLFFREGVNDLAPQLLR
jgi:hypothetical protein